MAKAKAKKFELNCTPIVAVLGHVDHGKTSLLDAIRGTDVQAKEAGGITQNTRAHQVEFQEHKITFVDTPGHEAFAKMRSRGARVTDIVLLVVAADDGVQPQTKESIEFAKKEKVPVIVAINKIDLPGKNLVKIRQELTNAGLHLEEYGGDVMVVEVSALKKTGLNELLERILLLAEISELKRKKTTKDMARVFVLESSLDNRQGPVALCIVKEGEVNITDIGVYRTEAFKIRSLLNHEQKNIQKAEQGDPIWIVGINDVLNAGDDIIFCKNEKDAKVLARETRDNDESREAIVLTEQKDQSDIDLLASMFETKEVKEKVKFLNLVLKTDTQGTLEAVKEQLTDLNDEDVEVKFIKSETGNITEEDVMLAKNSRGIVIGFQVAFDKHVGEIARKERVLVRNYSIIYDLIHELSDAMDSMLEPAVVEVEVARLIVKKAFVLSNGKHVAGCEVIKGNIVKGSKVYVNRGKDEKIFEGKIVSLKTLKTEVKEVKKGQECGVLLEPDVAFEEGDELASVKIEKA